MAKLHCTSLDSTFDAAQTDNKWCKLPKDQVLETILSGVNLLEEHVTIENKLDEATKCLTEYYAFKKDFQEKEAKDCILMLLTGYNGILECSFFGSLSRDEEVYAVKSRFKQKLSEERQEVLTELQKRQHVGWWVDELDLNDQTTKDLLEKKPFHAQILEFYRARSDDKDLYFKIRHLIRDETTRSNLPKKREELLAKIKDDKSKSTSDLELDQTFKELLEIVQVECQEDREPGQKSAS